MRNSESFSVSEPLVSNNSSILSKIAAFCCCLRSNSPPPPPHYTELRDLKEAKETLSTHIPHTSVIVPVQLASLTHLSSDISPVKKKNSKKKGLPVINSLVEGYQVIGNGKETVIATMSRTQVEFNKTTFRSDLKKKT